MDREMLRNVEDHQCCNPPREMSEMSHPEIYVERGWGWESVGSAGLMKTLFKEIRFVNCNLLTIAIAGSSIFAGIRCQQLIKKR